MLDTDKLNCISYKLVLIQIKCQTIAKIEASIGTGIELTGKRLDEWRKMRYVILCIEYCIKLYLRLLSGLTESQPLVDLTFAN